MARPRKIKMMFEDGVRIDARVINSKHGNSSCVCLNCVPHNTEMTALGDITQYGFAGTDSHITIWQCSTCGTQYAVAYTVKYVE